MQHRHRSAYQDKSGHIAHITSSFWQFARFSDWAHQGHQSEIEINPINAKKFLQLFALLNAGH